MRTLRDSLFPGAAERDPEFRAEIERLSVRALRTIGWINLLMPATGVAVHVLAQQIEPVEYVSVRLANVLLFFLTGTVTLGLAGVRRLRPRARLLALANGFVSGALLIWFSFAAGAPGLSEPASFVNLVVILLVGVAIVPALPWQILLLGGALAWFHYAAAELTARRGWIPEISLHQYAGLEVILLLCVALSALNYRKLHETWTSHRNELAARERLLISENAALLGKLAATISHELNSPLGAVLSSLDSLERLESRRARGDLADSGRADGLHGTLIQTARMSLGSMQRAIARMQRFTNLDRSEAHAVDLRQLVDDVKTLLEPEWAGRVELDVRFGETPPVTVRPQQISAVLAKLLQNAIQASPPHGRIELTAGCRNGEVEITVRDQGQGLSSEDAANAFEPGFRVRAGRVTAGHWSLFSARQAVREHGGDLSIETEPGRGALLRMTLPRESSAPTPSGASLSALQS